MEKLAAISELFDISLDELVLGKKAEAVDQSSKVSGFLQSMEDKVCTQENKTKVRKGLKIAGILAGILVAADVASMIIYFLLYGMPK